MQGALRDESCNVVRLFSVPLVCGLGVGVGGPGVGIRVENWKVLGSGFKVPGCHQQPEVIYLPHFSPQLIPLEY